MNVKMNFRIITKNHTADSKIGSPQKIDFRANGTHEFHPTAWELKPRYSLLKKANVISTKYVINYLAANKQLC